MASDGHPKHGRQKEGKGREWALNRPREWMTAAEKKERPSVHPPSTHADLLGTRELRWSSGYIPRGDSLICAKGARGAHWSGTRPA